MLGAFMEHEATLVNPTEVKDGDGDVVWREGEPEVADVSPDGPPGPTFDCLLILPGAGQQVETPRGRRTVKRPTLLHEEEGLELNSASLLDVVAEEVTGPDPVRWQVDADAVPLALPGWYVGGMVFVKRVDD